MNRFLLLLLFVFYVNKLPAQEYETVLDEVLTVNSTSAINGNTRNKAEVTFPESTIGYIYRISITPKGQTEEGEGLFKLLQNVPINTISIGSQLASFAIKNNDGNSVDAFIFNNVYDASDFYNKKDGNWSACKSMPNRVNCCFSSKDCMNNRIFFGFQNNNIMEGLDVHLEVVAVVDKSNSDNKSYSFSILNSTDRELKFLISLDEENWEKLTLASGYLTHPSFSQPNLFVKIVSSEERFVKYKITPYERYQLIWNTQKDIWDLVHY